jgi:type IV secretory pathway VirB3-like protein
MITFIIVGGIIGTLCALVIYAVLRVKSKSENELIDAGVIIGRVQDGD